MPYDYPDLSQPPLFQKQRNPRSAATTGIAPEIILYLESPPSPETLKKLLVAAGFSEPRQLMRRNEEIYKTLGLADKTLTEDQLLAAMASHPKLIERPLVVNGDRARLGRPPEQVLEILDC